MTDERVDILRDELRRREGREYNSLHEWQEFMPGDTVLFYQPPRLEALAEKHYVSHWLGPFVVIRRKSDVNYWIRDYAFDARIVDAVELSDACIACKSKECSGVCVATPLTHPFFTDTTYAEPLQKTIMGAVPEGSF